MDEEDLDWGDTEIAQNVGLADDDDGVSLGSDSGDEANNAAVHVTTAARNSPPLQAELNGASGSGSPKSTSFPAKERSLQRESSSNSIKSVKRNESSSTASPKPRNRRSKSSSASVPKLIHGLPPKPVVANLPLLPPSHPSLTEATRISDSGGKAKPNSNANKSASLKPISSDVEGPLPPDWQIRHPRSGDRDAIYYYNTRTHQSTWTRPDFNSPSTRSNPESDHPRAGLSYEDRHYRPGTGGLSDNDAPLSHTNRRGDTDTWFGNSTEDRRDQSPPPSRPRNRSRSLSPHRGKEYAGGRRNRPHNGRGQRHANSDRDRESSVVQENDRHWVPPSEGSASSSAASGPHKSRRSQRQPQDYPNDLPPSYDSRRSPPRAREPRQEIQEPLALSTSTNTGKRDRPSRFAPSTPAIIVSSSQDDDAWVPDEFKVLSPSADRRTNPVQRENREDRHPVTESRNMYSTANDGSASSSHPVGPSEEPQQSTSRRKRAPLPPQSMRFEMSKSGGRGAGDSVPNIGSADAAAVAYHSTQVDPHSPAPSSTVSHAHPGRGSALHRDPPPHQRAPKPGPLKIDHDVPHYNQSKDGHRGERGREEGRERGSERERRDKHRDDFADDRSSTSSSRPHARPRSISADPTIRAGSGMYADRESIAVDDSAPRAPRGMAGSTMNMYPNRQGRSPPSSQRPGDIYDSHGLPPLPSRDGPRSWKEEMFKFSEKGVSRGRGRRGMGRGAPPALSGTNSIPVAMRHGSDHGVLKVPQNHFEKLAPSAPSGLSSANMVPVKNPRSRGYGNQESSDHGEHFKGVYPPSEIDVPEYNRHVPSMYEKEEDDYRGGGQSRRRSFNEDTRLHIEGGPRPTRRWGPSSPQEHRYNGSEDHRPPASPLIPHEPPSNDRDRSSDHGQASGRHRSPSRHHHNDESDVLEGPRHTQSSPVSERLHIGDLASNGHRPHGLPMKPTMQFLPEIPPDYRRRRSMSGSDAPWEHSPVDHRHRPNSPNNPSEPPPVKIRRPPPYSYERDPLPHDTMDYDIPMDGIAGPSGDRRPNNPRRPGSLLDRLGDVDAAQTPSLRERVNVPLKRDRDDVGGREDRYSVDGDGDEIVVGEHGSKRAKKRHAKSRRGRGRGPATPYA